VGRAAALTALWFGLLASPAFAADRPVAVSVFDYRPNTMTINPGDSVAWRWSGPDTNHSVTALRGEAEQFDSDPGRSAGAINHEVGETFRHTFTKAGAFAYLCRVHPRFMRGTVVVRAVPDHAPPRIRSPRTSPSTQCASEPRRCRKPRVRLHFRLSERARVTVRIRRVGTRRSPTPVRTVKISGRKGRNDIPPATGALQPARYRLTLTATDAVGNVSMPVRVHLAVKRTVSN
jgi:plastocyanin